MSAHNPYLRAGSWYWFDESEPYATQVEALVDLELYCHWLNKGADLRPMIMLRWQKQIDSATGGQQ